MTGNAVNVPPDVNSTVNMLPRLSDETGTIKVTKAKITIQKFCTFTEYKT